MPACAGPLCPELWGFQDAPQVFVEPRRERWRARELAARLFQLRPLPGHECAAQTGAQLVLRAHQLIQAAGFRRNKREPDQFFRSRDFVRRHCDAARLPTECSCIAMTVAICRDWTTPHAL